MGNVKEIRHLTVEEALYCVGDKKQIHTFINAPFGLIGADWSRENLVEKLENAQDIQIGGEACRNMGHGIVLFPQGAKKQSDFYFIECDNEKLSELDVEEKDDNQLKPCPFCGNKEIKIEVIKSKEDVLTNAHFCSIDFVCGQCKMAKNTNVYGTDEENCKQEAIRLWNGRVNQNGSKRN